MRHFHYNEHKMDRRVYLITTGMVALASLYAGAAYAGVSASSGRDQGKRAEGKAKDQERLQQQIREEAAAAPGIADEKARQDMIRRRKTIAKRGETILTSEAPLEAGKTVLGG